MNTTILEHYGNSVLPAHDGNAGTALARSEPPDAILSVAIRLAASRHKLPVDMSIPVIEGSRG